MTPTARLWNFGILLSCIGLVMYIVGFSTDWWCDLDNEVYAPITGARINAHFGLWRKCITISVNNSERVITDGCEDMDNDEAYKPAVKTLCSVGLILSILGVPIAILAGCSASPKAMAFGGTLILVGGNLALSVFISLPQTVAAVVGSAVYIGKAKDIDDRLEAEYSSFLALIGSIVAGAGAICQLLSIRTGYYTLA